MSFNWSVLACNVTSGGGHAPSVLTQTDACPIGLGGFLMIGGCFHSCWRCAIQEAYKSVLGATVGYPAFQAEWEFLAAWISLEVFVAPLRFPEGSPRIVLRTDNTSAQRSYATQGHVSCYDQAGS